MNSPALPHAKIATRRSGAADATRSAFEKPLPQDAA
jgi:hypothetical protein